MQYISIDIETTGLDYRKHQILEFAAIATYIGGTTPLDQLPCFHRLVKHDQILGQVEALAMNADLLQLIAKPGKAFSVTTPENLIGEFWAWLSELGVGETNKGSRITINVAGKNFASFDKLFIEALDTQGLIKIRHRTLDPAILYFQAGDKSLPNLQTCKERAGVEGQVFHRALNDALDVIQLIRHKLG